VFWRVHSEDYLGINKKLEFVFDAVRYTNKQLKLLPGLLSQHSDSAMGWMTQDRFPAGARKGSFLLSAAYRPVLGTTRPLIQWIPGLFFPGLRRLGRESYHSCSKCRG
jgi:hypothetical protein